jgi:hypothetical protein
MKIDLDTASHMHCAKKGVSYHWHSHRDKRRTRCIIPVSIPELLIPIVKSGVGYILPLAEILLTDPRSLPLTDQGKHTHLNRTCHKIICRKIIAPLVNRQYVDHRWDTWQLNQPLLTFGNSGDYIKELIVQVKKLSILHFIIGQAAILLIHLVLQYSTNADVLYCRVFYTLCFQLLSMTLLCCLIDSIRLS